MAAHVGRRRIAVVVALAAGGSLLVACGGSDDPAAPTSAACPTVLAQPTMSIKLSTIHLNVYNATGEADLASDVATELKWRGLKIISVGNDPDSDHRATPKTAEIRYGKGGKQIALTLATQIKDPVLHKDDRTNPSVDLIIGDHFKLVPVPPPKPSKVTVNIYNTTYHSGWATKVAGEFEKRGFTVEKYGNDPHGRFWPKDSAVIFYGKQGEPAARRVALQFKDAHMKQIDRESTVVDVDLGNKFTSLVPVAKATPKPTPTHTKPSC